MQQRTSVADDRMRVGVSVVARHAIRFHTLRKSVVVVFCSRDELLDGSQNVAMCLYEASSSDRIHSLSRGLLFPELHQLAQPVLLLLFVW
jgi:hypothetical protein